MRPALSPLLATFLLLGAACGSGKPAGAGETPRPGGTSTPTGAISSPPASPDCAEQVLRSLSERQRVGQLFLLGLAGDELGAPEAAAIRTHDFGSVWFTQTTHEGVQMVRAVADQVQALASPSTTGGVRFFVAANQEGGLIQALRGPGFSTIPSAVDQGRMSAPALRRAAEGWGHELAAAGVNLDFAPVLDVVPPGTDARNQPIGVLMREFGHDPATVGREGVAFLQGMADAHVATTGKHFPGLGRVEGNTDDTSGVVDGVTTANDPFQQPFQQAVDAGVPFVMVALATYTRIDPVHLGAFSPIVMRLLRGEVGFGGVIVSDDLGETKAVAAMAPADRALDFLRAGGDLIISKTVGPASQMAAAILSKASADAGFRSLVDAAAVRVLRAKEPFGLLQGAGCS